MVVTGALVATSTVEPTFADQAQSAFYLVALLSIGGLGLGLFLIRTMEGRLIQAESDAEAQGFIQGLGIPALAAVDATAVLAGVGALLTGDLLVLAFGRGRFSLGSSWRAAAETLAIGVTAGGVAWAAGLAVETLTR